MVVQARRDPDHFDSLAYSYDSVTPRHIAEHYLSRRTTFITKQLPRPARILDIGCGTGRLASRLSIMGFEVTGLDFSAQMLKVARSRNLVGAQGSVDCLPFADETFDASISIAVLHHLGEEKLVRKAIQEMVRVTRKGGTIIVWDHNPLNPYWPVIMKKVPQDVGSERLVPVGEILGGLVDERIKEIVTFRLGFVPDFVPEKLLPLVQKLEKLLERNILTRHLAAHNVVMARKV